MRWTQREHKDFQRTWLLARQGHKWGKGAGCDLCGAKYCKTNTRRFCPKRRRPNRWRLHFQRAVMKAQYPREGKVVRNAAWIIGQMAKIRREVSRDPRFEEDLRYWKYHRLARRYRRLMRDWWALPAREVRPFQHADTPRDDFGAYLTRGRKRLIQQVQREQCRVITEGGCTYTFHAHAEWLGRPLFTE